ncbi:hypothetical protein [Lactiplantibacillus herbarum]|uniref:hypothetical protein n=1 Tax=Lactiplantibacillus herbarum TaxID=1670446 RepID=UPI00064F6213|nr:hypothetical protein [Lactiplantibacillus herbarum]
MANNKKSNATEIKLFNMDEGQMSTVDNCVNQVKNEIVWPQFKQEVLTTPLKGILLDGQATTYNKDYQYFSAAFSASIQNMNININVASKNYEQMWLATSLSKQLGVNQESKNMLFPGEYYLVDFLNFHFTFEVQEDGSLKQKEVKIDDDNKEFVKHLAAVYGLIYRQGKNETAK